MGLNAECGAAQGSYSPGEGCHPHVGLRSIAVCPVEKNVGSSPRRPADCTLQAGIDFLSLSKLGDYLRERQFLAAAFHTLQQTVVPPSRGLLCFSLWVRPCLGMVGVIVLLLMLMVECSAL